MDIESAEFEFLSKLDSKIAKNIRNIVAECHLRVGDISQLEKLLKEAGYRVEKFTLLLVKKASYPIKVRDLASENVQKVGIHYIHFSRSKR